jgi:hypothetical protein
MRLLMAAVASMLAMVAGGAPTAHADTDSATRYYLSLGDSLATGTNANGIGQAFTDSGYADQLYAALAASDPKLELKKVGCPGESSASLRFGSQPPTTVLLASLLQERPLLQGDAARRGGRPPRGAQGQGGARHDRHRCERPGADRRER